MRRNVVIACLVIAALSLSAASMELRYLGNFEPPREGWEIDGVPIGEISGLTLSSDGSFYAIGDDRGENVDPPGVLYKMDIAIDLTGIHAVDATGWLQLDSDRCAPCGQPYSVNEIDGEEVLWTPDGFIVCSERDAEGRPWIRSFNHFGKLLDELPIPEKFIPEFEGAQQTRGVRENLSFEAGAVHPDGSKLYVANEQALIQDGDLASFDAGTLVRIVEYDLSQETAAVVGEYVYETEPVFVEPEEGKFGDNGVVGMVYVGHITTQFDLIVMERSYVSGVGNHIGLFGVKLSPYIYDRERIMATDSLAPHGIPYTGLSLMKTPLLALSDDPWQTDILLDPDNMEAIALGPQLENGNYSLILASDNNFNPKYQRNVFAAFEIDLDPVKMSAIVLGAGGGPREEDLSSYLVFPAGLPGDAVAVDAGSLTTGIRAADELGNLWDFRVPTDSNLTREGFVFQNTKAYLISHEHLDHVAGHYINAPVDVFGRAKPILGLQKTIDSIASGIYNWGTWPDFVSLGYYEYMVLEPSIAVSIPETAWSVEAWPVSHGAPYQSCAFLLECEGYYLLYVGDAGPDGVEETGQITLLWERVAPLVASGSLLGLFLEASYPEGRPDELLFGHMTPSWMMAELHQLASLANPSDPYDALCGFPVVVTGIKPVMQRVEPPRNAIERQLKQLNDLGIEFILPYQGMRIDFRVGWDR